MGSQLAFLASQVSGSGAAEKSDSGIDIFINGYYDYTLFGHKLSITNTHISLVLVMLTLIIFAIVANRAIKKADPTKAPGTF